MTTEETARTRLLDRVMGFAATEGVAGKSLREIATGADTSHRMLLYHFGSHEGLLAAMVAAMEAQQRLLMTALAEEAGTPGELMLLLWDRLTDPDVLPFVRLFFEVFGLVAQGVPGTEGLRTTLTEPWLADAAAVAERLGQPPDPAGLRLGVAVARGLLLDLAAGADPTEVDAAYRRFVDLAEAEGERARSSYPTREELP